MEPSNRQRDLNFLFGTFAKMHSHLYGHGTSKDPLSYVVPKELNILFKRLIFLKGIEKSLHETYFEKTANVGLRLDENVSKVQPHQYEYFLRYQLFVHEYIQDYMSLRNFTKNDIRLAYRAKHPTVIIDKLKRNAEKPYPLNKILNDIFGLRFVVADETYRELLQNQENYETFFANYGYRFLERNLTVETETYRAIHLYTLPDQIHHFPWEVQIWPESNALANVESHRKHKRSFLEKD